LREQFVIEAAADLIQRDVQEPGLRHRHVEEDDGHDAEAKLPRCDEPLVSSDYIGSHESSTVDALSTNVVNGTLVNVTSWYDNEMGYSARCVDLLRYIGARK